MRTFKAENGNTLTAINDTQADAMIKGGMIEITEDSKPDVKPVIRKPREPKEPK
jgi:hypothetical protein